MLALREVKDKVGILTFNHLERRNALSRPLVDELIEGLNAFQRDGVRVVILRSMEGAKVWSAGHDFHELPESKAFSLDFDDPLVRLINAVQEFPAPVIAMIQGSVWGGSCELVIACDIAVGDESSSFAVTPAKLGLPYDAVGMWRFVNRIGLAATKEMFFTSDSISAERAQAIGLLNHKVPSDQLAVFTLTLAERIASRSAVAISVMKEQLRLLTAANPVSQDALEKIRKLQRQLCDSTDYREGVQAFLEKRPAKFSG